MRVAVMKYAADGFAFVSPTEYVSDAMTSAAVSTPTKRRRVRTRRAARSVSASTGAARRVANITVGKAASRKSSGQMR